MEYYNWVFGEDAFSSQLSFICIAPKYDIHYFSALYRVGWKQAVQLGLRG